MALLPQGGLTRETTRPGWGGVVWVWVAGEGFEPPTFGL